MSKTSLVLSLGAIGTIGAVLALTPAGLTARAADLAAPGRAVGGAAGAATPPAAAPSTQPADADTAGLESVLSGRPDRPDRPTAAQLDKPFESLSGGISFRPPAGLKPLREVGKDYIIQFQSKDRSWALDVGRTSFPRPQPLTLTPDARGNLQPGLIQNIIQAVKAQYGGGTQDAAVRVLRDDLTNLGNSDVGMIVYRYTKNGERWLGQRAIIQANDQLYYMLALTTPGRRDDNDTPEDPGERVAVETFRAVLDSVKLLDRAKIRDDQVARLYRTRALFTNLTERKLMSVLIPKQWRRIQKDGRDIGYQYIEEAPVRKALQDGIQVSVRTRVMPGGAERPFPREDSAANFFTSADRRHEDWSKLTAIDDGKPKTPQNPWKKLTEFGTTDLQTERRPLVDANDPDRPENAYLRGEAGDVKQPWMVAKDVYRMDVQYAGSMGDLEPVNRPSLPPFYLPQALGTMLPRLLPPNEPKTYLVATYVSDAREVMLRYLDVGAEQEVTLGGRPLRAVPITDRVTLEGAVTTHYVDRKGNWLGSQNRVIDAQNKPSVITILPTDEATLLALWKDANLTRPADNLDDGPTRAAAADNARDARETSPGASPGASPGNGGAPRGGTLPRRLGSSGAGGTEPAGPGKR